MSLRGSVCWMVSGCWITSLERSGDRSTTLFWKDPRLDGFSFSLSFNILFELANNKLATVVDIFSLGWGEYGEAWKFRHSLCGRRIWWGSVWNFYLLMSFRVKWWIGGVGRFILLIGTQWETHQYLIDAFDGDIIVTDYSNFIHILWSKAVPFVKKKKQFR